LQERPFGMPWRVAVAENGSIIPCVVAFALNGALHFLAPPL